jgi:ABC-type nitrate/sulfonate/bicarbonate transport system permease component
VSTVTTAGTRPETGRPPAEMVRRRSSPRLTSRRSVLVGIARVATIVVLLAIWQFAPNHLVPTIAVSRPSSVVHSFGHLISTGELFRATWATARQVLYALVIGAVIGIALAVLTSVPIGRWLLGPLISATYAIPKVGLISFYILLLGVNTKAHVVFVIGFVLFAYYFPLRDAFEDIDQEKLTALRLMGAGPLSAFRILVIPSAVPHLYTASRIAVPLAFASEVFAELEMPTSSGLGVTLQNSTNNLDIGTGVAVALFIVLIGYLLDLVIGARLRRYTDGMGTGMVL